MHAYSQLFRTRDMETPQTEPAREDQVLNSAGGYVFAVDDWVRLDRFLVLGAEGGSYYASERKLVRENAEAVLSCLKADGPRVVRRIVEISQAGRAPKNDPALFALAMAMGLGDAATRAAAAEALPHVARIGTHLFQLLKAVQGFRGWGRSLKRAISRWYLTPAPEALAFQVVKYQQRGGWSHRDVLRLAKPKAAADDLVRRAIFQWACKGMVDDAAPAIIKAVAALPGLEGRARAEAIRANRLPREVVPTEWLKDAGIWAALLDDMPMTAMLRTLNRMTAVGLLKPLSDAEATVCQHLREVERLRKARVHPLAILIAQRTYAQGHGERGSLTWEPSQSVVKALDDAFHLAFKAVEPSGKRILLALDVSGSMGAGSVAGSPLTPREAAAALALVTVATEPRTHVVGFTSGASGEWRGQPSMRGGYMANLLPLDLAGKRVAEVCRYTEALPMGSTDCAVPMLYALDSGIEADAFMVLTDNETWAGAIHPFEALRRYRERTGIAAKLVVVGMVSNGFTIADPNDAGMLDVVGMDTAMPALVTDWIAGRL